MQNSNILSTLGDLTSCTQVQCTKVTVPPTTKPKNINLTFYPIKPVDRWGLLQFRPSTNIHYLVICAGRSLI